ncbi:MAG: hypothetical protein UY07_C0033G0009 [Parcubacteria group bacterium GW2011_GWA1_47_8]|nr:MAG: hypothetical protein UY07_C0033G0009 [Parcubacteria group bacterium GW2011_GWA1_47_8]
MMTKKIAFFVGLGALVSGILLTLTSEVFCPSPINADGYLMYVWSYCGMIALSLEPLTLLIPFSLITYWMKDEVFRTWWNFARWWMLVIIVVRLLIGSEVTEIDGDVWLFVLILLYSILTTLSLAKIIHTYLKLKYQEQKASEAKLEKLDRVLLWFYRIFSLSLVLFLLVWAGLTYVAGMF